MKLTFENEWSYIGTDCFGFVLFEIFCCANYPGIPRCFKLTIFNFTILLEG